MTDHEQLSPAHTILGATVDEVAALDGATVDLFTGYHEAVDAATRTYLDGLADDDFDRVVDDRYDPPVTVATRLVSVIGDCLAHLGQAQYVRGLAERAEGG